MKKDKKLSKLEEKLSEQHFDELGIITSLTSTFSDNPEIKRDADADANNEVMRKAMVAYLESLSKNPSLAPPSRDEILRVEELIYEDADSDEPKCTTILLDELDMEFCGEFCDLEEAFLRVCFLHSDTCEFLYIPQGRFLDFRIYIDGKSAYLAYYPKNSDPLYCALSGVSLLARATTFDDKEVGVITEFNSNTGHYHASVVVGLNLKKIKEFFSTRTKTVR